MKKTVFNAIPALLIGVILCIASRQEAKATEPTDYEMAASVAEADIIPGQTPKSFLENFYKGLDEDLLDYAFIKKHTTRKAIKYLADNYDYDCDTDECLATWIFLYEGGGDIGPLKTRTFEMLNKTTCKVTQIYEVCDSQDYEYIVKLGLVRIGDNYKIDTIEPMVSSND